MVVVVDVGDDDGEGSEWLGDGAGNRMEVSLVKKVVEAGAVMMNGAGGKNFRFLGGGARLDECC